MRVLLTNDDGIEADGLQTLRRALLQGAPRSLAGQTAPPHGLALAAVGYPPYPRSPT